MNNRLYSLWLLKASVGQTTKRKLYEYFHGAFNVYFASEEDLRASCIFNTEVELFSFIKERASVDLQKLMDSMMAGRIEFITVEDKEYPMLLRQIYDYPYGFYYIGSLPDDNCIAMVGARDCSGYGRKMATELSEALTQMGYTIVSGMARGIDTISHRGALTRSGTTVAVLGCGVDVIYPRENARLYEEIVESGCVLSEYNIGQQPLSALFPARNRIIAGLCRKVIVVEAREKSGSLITADAALDQGKDIYAIPGRITDPLSAGCNRLIAQGAGIITSVQQFIDELNEFSDEGNVYMDNRFLSGFHLEKEELLVYSNLDYVPKSLSLVQQELSMDYLKLLAVIMNLVSKGYIKEVFKNQFVICR